MSKAMLEAARSLIQDGKYAEARAILHDLDHPVAVKWLSQIDDLQRARMAQKQPKTARRIFTWVAAGIGILAVVLFGKYTTNQSGAASSAPPASITPTYTATYSPETTSTPIALVPYVDPTSLTEADYLSPTTSFFGGTLCGDGTYSSSTGRGTCSHHSGEAGRSRTRSRK